MPGSGGFFGGMAQGIQSGASLANEWDKIEEEERNNEVRRESVRSDLLNQQRAREVEDRENDAAAAALQARQRIGQPADAGAPDDALREPPGTPAVKPLSTSLPPQAPKSPPHGLRGSMRGLGKQFVGGFNGFRDWSSGLMKGADGANLTKGSEQ